MRRVDQVVRLDRVEAQVVQRLARQLDVAPAVREQQVLGRAVVDVGEHRPQAVAEAADVLPALGAHRAHRLVGRVVGQLGEDRVVDLLDLAPHHRQQRAALEPRRRLDPGELADRREQVDVRDERVRDPAAVRAARARA